MSSLIKKISAVVFAATFVMIFTLVGGIEQNMISLSAGMLAIIGNFLLMMFSGKIAGAFEPTEEAE